MDTNYAYNVGRFLLFYFQLEGEIQIFGFRQRLLKLTASLFLPDSKKNSHFHFYFIMHGYEWVLN